MPVMISRPRTRMRLLQTRTAAPGLLLPAELADQRNELGRTAIFDAPLRSYAADAGQSLRPLRTDRDQELSRPLELLEQRLGYFRSRCSDNDAIEGCLIRPAVGAIEHPDRDVVDLQRADQFRGPQRQLVDPLDRKYFRAQFGEYDGLVSRSRANLQHFLAAGEFEELDHPAD